MSNIQLVKYNSERAAKYRTATTITVKNRKKTAIKSPLCEEASIYVDGMYTSRERLAYAYEGSNLSVANCTKSDDGVLIDFIPGKSLDELIADKTKGNPQLLKEEFRRFSELICGCGLVSFSPCDDFKKIFGELEFENMGKSLAVTSFALHPHNIIVDKNGSCVFVDFEFFFNFPVPINFILYRALNALKKRHAFKGVDACYILDITADEKNSYRIMEERFVKYICDDYSLNETVLTDKFLKPQFNAVTKRYHSDSNNHRSYLFYDIGDGYNELNKIEAISILNGDTFEVRFYLPAIIGIKSLRFDPIEGVGSEICILDSTVDDEPLSLKAINRDDCYDGFDVFHHLDPIYAVKLSSELPPIEIVINYKLNVIDFESLYKITAEKLSIASAKKGILGGLFGKK